jgi:multidrug resistance efflux pump
MKNRRLIFAVLIPLVLTFTGCVARERYMGLLDEAKTYQKNLQKEQTRNNELSKKVSDLEKTVASRTADRADDIERLRDELARVKSDAERAGELSKRLADLTLEIDHLKTSFQGREAILKEEIERLRTQIASQRDEAARREMELAAIREKYEDMIVGIVKKMTKGE